MYTKPKVSTFCHHYTRHRVDPTRSYSDTTSTDSNDFPSPSEERRRQMTFAWAAEQEFLRSDRQPMSTEEWVKEQRNLLPTTSKSQYQSASRKTKVKAGFMGERVRMRDAGSGGKVFVMETVSSSDEGDDWRKFRRNARSRIREEFEKMEEHLRVKQEAERVERAAREKMARAALEEKVERDRIRVEVVVRKAWNEYEDGWTRITSSTPPNSELTFESIPWPIMMKPKDENDFTKNSISGFLFSPLHSSEVTRKERLRRALLRWHPDRFTRHRNRICEQDKEKVLKAVGIITSILNDLI